MSCAVAEDNAVLNLPYCATGDRIQVDLDGAEYVKTSNGTVFHVDELPKFDSREAANAYLNGMMSGIANPIDHHATINFSSRATNGHALVKSINFGTNSLHLFVDYTTSGDGNTGRITYHNAYTSFVGFTLGTTWHELTCYSQVTSSGKDIYASASGELEYYLIVEGFIELGREFVGLDGYCYAVR